MGHALFQVAIKTILKKDDKILVLLTNDNYIDFPGGRLNEDERDQPPKEVVLREIKEELGEKVKIQVGKLAFVSRRTYTHEGAKNYILAIYYEADYLEGEIVLSDEHAHLQWLAPKDIFQLSGQFQSDDEKQQLVEYFNIHE